MSDTGGAEGGAGINLDTGELDLYGLEQSTAGMTVPGQTQTESAFGYGVPGSERATSDLQSEVMANEAGLGLGLSRPGLGGSEVQKRKKPEEPSKVEPAATPRTGGGTESRKRRRSLLLQEEGGFLSPLAQAPIRRRTLFG